MHGRRECQRPHLLLDGFKHSLVVMTNANDIDARESIQVLLALDVPVVDAVGPRHQ